MHAAASAVAPLDLSRAAARRVLMGAAWLLSVLTLGLVGIFSAADSEPPQAGPDCAPGPFFAQPASVATITPCIPNTVIGAEHRVVSPAPTAPTVSKP